MPEDPSGAYGDLVNAFHGFINGDAFKQSIHDAIARHFGAPAATPHDQAVQQMNDQANAHANDAANQSFVDAQAAAKIRAKAAQRLK